MSIKEIVKQCLREKKTLEYNVDYFYQKRRMEYNQAVKRLEREEKADWIKRVEGIELPHIHCLFMDFSSPFSDIDKKEEKEIQRMGQEDILLLVQKGGMLSADALFYVAAWYGVHPETWILYGDEDCRDERGKRENPWLKPEWSPDLFLSCFYFGGAVAIRGDKWREFIGQKDWKSAGIYEMCYNLIKEAGGFLPENPNPLIGHTGVTLFHNGRNTKRAAEPKSWKLEDIPKIQGKISIVIPSKDQPELLERNLNSLRKTAPSHIYEIILVDNGSTKENRNRVEELKQEMEENHISCRYLYHPMPFHFSRMCNIGAKEARNEFLLFLNDDVEAVQPGWMEKMMDLAGRAYTGAVGIKLLYPDSDKIQHAGIVNLPMGPVHKLQFHRDSEEYYFGRNRMEVNVSAVTGACLMVRKEVFWDCGGFCEELPVAFNDVDLCFSLLEGGYYNVVVNSMYLYHHESLSRGNDEAPEAAKRLMEERDKLYVRHPGQKGEDPYYHKRLNRKALDTRLVPLIEDMEVDCISAKKSSLKKEVRLHPGLLFRIEQAEGGYLQGYMLMIGDDNACYDKYLILHPYKRAEKEEFLPASEEKLISTIDGEVYLVKAKGELRLDLEQNMPDQKNVALSGIALQVKGLPPGEYAVGAILKNKVTYVTYLNWSIKKICIPCE